MFYYSVIYLMFIFLFIYLKFLYGIVIFVEYLDYFLKKM